MSIFDIFRSRPSVSPFEGATDYHSHILPGVDDGVKTMDDSLRILDEYERLGFKELWLTPHIMEDVPNEPADLRNRFEELKSHYKGSLKLNLAAENMLDQLFLSRYEADRLLTIGKNNDHILVETSYFTPPAGLDSILEKIKKKGYFPLLAHPERYVYMDDDDYRRLVDMDVKLQLNVLSLTGFYGKTAQAKSRKLLKKGMYTCFGTDLHRLKQVPYLNELAETVRLDLSKLSAPGL